MASGVLCWRPSAGRIEQFLLLDEFWTFKAKTLGHFDVHLHPHSGIDLASVKDDLEFEHCTLEEPTGELPLGVFEAHPVGAKRTSLVTFTRSRTTLSIC